MCDENPIDAHDNVRTLEFASTRPIPYRFENVTVDPADKSVKVANYCRNLVHEVETIAHSCGVAEPRRLRRYHVRIVQADGNSIPFDILRSWPDSPDELFVSDL